MDLAKISTGLPYAVTSQLMPTEKVHYFSYIAFEGGCSEIGRSENYWLALTDRRVMYRTKVSELKNIFHSYYFEKDGDLPFEKISFIEVSEGHIAGQGCSTKKAFQLRISTSGGTLIIPIPTKEKGFEIRKVYAELNNKPL